MNKIAGYKAWTEFVQANASKTIYALFSGGKDAATGKSWCPDCVTAEPVSYWYTFTGFSIHEFSRTVSMRLSDSALTVLMNGHFKVVTGELDKLPEGSTFVYVDVGGRDYWKNKSNEFR